MAKLWLDDERDPKDPQIQMEFGAEGDEVWAKSAQQAISYLQQGNVESISLDHDLGSGAGTGYDVAKWMEERAYDGTLSRVQWAVHSLNPVGARNIERALTSADHYWKGHEAQE